METVQGKLKPPFLRILSERCYSEFSLILRENKNFLSLTKKSWATADSKKKNCPVGGQ